MQSSSPSTGIWTYQNFTQTQIILVIYDGDTVNPFVPNATFPYSLKGGSEMVHWEQMGQCIECRDTAMTF